MDLLKKTIAAQYVSTHRRSHSRKKLTLRGVVTLWTDPANPLIHAGRRSRAYPEQTLDVDVIILPKQPIVALERIVHICRVEQVCAAHVDRNARLLRIGFAAEHGQEHWARISLEMKDKTPLTEGRAGVFSYLPLVQSETRLCDRR